MNKKVYITKIATALHNSHVAEISKTEKTEFRKITIDNSKVEKYDALCNFGNGYYKNYRLENDTLLQDVLNTKYRDLGKNIQDEYLKQAAECFDIIMLAAEHQNVKDLSKLSVGGLLKANAELNLQEKDAKANNVKVLKVAYDVISRLEKYNNLFNQSLKNATNNLVASTEYGYTTLYKIQENNATVVNYYLKSIDDLVYPLTFIDNPKKSRSDFFIKPNDMDVLNKFIDGQEIGLYAYQNQTHRKFNIFNAIKLDEIRYEFVSYIEYIEDCFDENKFIEHTIYDFMPEKTVKHIVQDIEPVNVYGSELVLEPKK